MKCSVVLALLGLTASLAFANREPDTTYDARSVGMGGTGAATADGNGAIYHNTARLSDIGEFHLGITVSPYMPQASGPWADPMTFAPVTRKSTRAFAPFPMLNVAYRVHKRVVVGVAGFAAGGGGSKYENVPILGNNTAEIRAVIFEVQVPIAIQVSPKLSIGAAYRAGYGRVDIKIPQLANAMDPSMGFVMPETTFSGTTAAAVQVGVHYRPTSGVQLGAGYRSKLSIDMDGDTKIADTVVADDLTINSSEPHRFVVGAAAQLLDHRLLLATDVTYWLYSESHKANAAEFRATDWKDAFNLGVGAEFAASSKVIVRGGYAVGRMATSNGSASAFEAPPGTRHTFTVGAGLKLDKFTLDVGGAYGVVPGKTIAAGMNQGTYKFNSLMGSITGSYHY